MNFNKYDHNFWNDKYLNINWGVKKPIISKKDKLLKTFLEI